MLKSEKRQRGIEKLLRLKSGKNPIVNYEFSLHRDHPLAFFLPAEIVANHCRGAAMKRI